MNRIINPITEEGKNKVLDNYPQIASTNLRHFFIEKIEK